MLPARAAPLVGFALWASAVVASVAFLRAQAIIVVHEPVEIAAWLFATAVLFNVAGGALLAARAAEADERAATKRERASQPQRNATLAAEMLALANGYAAAGYLIAALWQAYPRALTIALGLHASLGAISVALYFASTTSYAPLPRAPDVLAART